MGFYHFFYIYSLEFYYKEELPLLPHLLVCLFLSVWTDGFLFSLMDYHPFNIHAFQAAHCNHSQLNMVMSALTASRVWSCSSIHFYALFIPESLSTARATVEGPVWKGQVSETSRTDWRQAGPGFEKRPCSLKCMFRRTRERLTGDGSGSKKLLKGRSLGKHLGPEL